MGSPRHDDNLVPIDDICTTSDIARLLHVGQPAVSNWKKRHADFPKPFALVNEKHTGLYRKSEIIMWYAKHAHYRTPDQLRELADLLEREMAAARDIITKE
jgi:hypothetical protein